MVSRGNDVRLVPDGSKRRPNCKPVYTQLVTLGTQWVNMAETSGLKSYMPSAGGIN